MLRRGLCGIDLKNQIIVTGFLYVALAVFGVVFGFLLVENPEYFTSSAISSERSWEAMENQKLENLPNLDEAMDDSAHPNYTRAMNQDPDNVEPDWNESPGEKEGENNADRTKRDVLESGKDYDYDLPQAGSADDTIVEEASNETNPAPPSTEGKTPEGENKENTTSEEKKPEEKPDLHHYFQLLRFIQNEGVEVMIASLLRLACSFLLISGVRLSRPWMLVPWLVEEGVEMVGGILQLILQSFRTGNWTFFGVLLVACLYCLGGYFIYSVLSYHVLLRRMLKQSKEVISSVSQGGFQVGLNYQRLEEECWQADPNLAAEFKDREPGFIRESKMSVEESDDYVLYVK